MRMLLPIALLLSADYRGTKLLERELPVVRYATRPPLVFGEHAVITQLEKDAYLLSAVFYPKIVLENGDDTDGISK